MMSQNPAQQGPISQAQASQFAAAQRAQQAAFQNRAPNSAAVVPTQKPPVQLHQQQHPASLPPNEQQIIPQQSVGQPPVQSALPLQQPTQLNEPEYSTPEEILEVLRGLPEPSEDDLETLNLEKALYKDSVYEQHMDYVHDRFNRIIKRKRSELQYYTQVLGVRQSQPGALFHGGYSGYGNGWTYNKFDVDIIYPRKRKRNNRQSDEINISAQQLATIAKAPEILVPIRLDVEKEKYRLRDTFTWNLKEQCVPVNLFAESLVEDYMLPLSLAPTVASSIVEQIKDYIPHTFVDISEPKYANSSMYRDEDMRIIIKLDITVGQHNLVDQFEWDINCSENSPEEFAEVMCKELGLSGEFKTAIAHSIREQAQLFTKSLSLVQYPFDGTPIEDEEIRREFCPPIIDYMRGKSHLKEYSPVLFEISELELDRQDKDRDRDSRRKRRQGRAGRRNGPALPDFRDHLRSFRTPVYSTVLPGGLDRNVEILRRIIEEERAEEDEAKNNGMYPGSVNSSNSSLSSTHRTRTMHGTPMTSQGFYDGYTPSPKPIGRPPINRHLATASNVNSSIASRYASPQPDSYIVTLKIPRLRQFLEHIRQTSYR